MNSNRLYIPLLLVVMLILLWWRLPDWFVHGNSRFIEPWGDGYKAYHAIFYHVEYDSTYSHFEGMNYPYGEHVVPGACQPLLSNGLRLLKQIGIDLSDYHRAVLHTSLLVGIVLCALFLYLIFVRLKLPAWYSLLLAIPLTFLAPQQVRLLSHYGLAHPEILPILYYLLLRWQEHTDWRWSLGIGAAVGLYSGIHFYYFAIASFAIFSWVTIRWLVRRDWEATLQYLGHGLLMLGLPLLFYLAWMIVPDTVTDRNPAPWGFFNYRGRPSGTFLDIDQPHWQFIDKWIPLHRADFEAQAYIGLVATAFVLFTLFWTFSGRWRRPSIAVVDEERRFVNYLYGSGILVLLFAVGLPFIISPLKGLIHYAGPIQQFRSIGRFAWVFYYAANIAMGYYLWQWLRTRSHAWRGAILALVLGILCFESYRHQRSLNLDLDVIENWAAGTTFLENGIDYERFQACLPVPYFNIGSDNFWWPPKGWYGQKPHTISMQTGLPLTSSMLTRTSLRQTMDQLQLVTEPYRLPRILEDYPNDKPLLLFWDSIRVQEFGDRFLHLRNGGTSLLYQEDWLQLYELPLESFEQRIKDKIADVEAYLETLYQTEEGIFLTDSLTPYFYRNFDDHKNTPAYRGKGELRGAMPQVNYLMDEVWETDFTGELNLSFWMHLNADRAPRTTIIWEELDAAGQELGKHEDVAHQAFQVLDDQGWGLISINLIKRQPNSHIRITIVNRDVIAGTQQVDELLLRPTDHEIAWRKDGELWWNNRVYPSAD